MNNKIVEPHDAWLEQGDIFSSLPVGYMAKENDEVVFATSQGPALLISHGCTIDKRRKGESAVETLSFLRIMSVADLPSTRQEMLRQRALEHQPPQVMYLGDIAAMGECYVSMEEIFAFPASLFRPSLVSHHPEQIEDLRLTPGLRDTRIGRLTQDGIQLFTRKWITFWTRLDPIGD